MRYAVWCLAVAACGRLDFDPLGGTTIGDATADAITDAITDGPPMLSCVEPAPTCGPAGTSSCCSSPLVPGGTFYRSYDVGTDDAYPDMTNPATVSTFRLDTYKVTVGRFRVFVTAGMGTQASPPPTGAGARTLNGMASQGGWDATWNTSLAASTAALVAAVQCNPSDQSWTDAAGSNDALPMNCITWYEALAFCAWDGGFLPTEAEWNYAAAGGAEQRANPWSNPPSDITVDCSHANYGGAAPCVNPPNGGVNRVGSESPTGDGEWGHADLGGDVWEWTLDSYQPTYGNPCDDCAVLTVDATNRVLRGGSFALDASYVRGAVRFSDTPGGRFADLGLRCARPQ